MLLHPHIFADAAFVIAWSHASWHVKHTSVITHKGSLEYVMGTFGSFLHGGIMHVWKAVCKCIACMLIVNINCNQATAIICFSHADEQPDIFAVCIVNGAYFITIMSKHLLQKDLAFVDFCTWVPGAW